MDTKPTIQLLGLALCSLGIVSGPTLAQSDSSSLLSELTPVTEQMLIEPPAEDWLLWRRTYASSGFSPLEQINKQNVAELVLAWQVDLEPGPNSPSPIVHDGVMYLLSTGDTLLAMDATSGVELWRYRHESEAVASAKIGIALYGDKLFMPTSDMRVVALDNKTGELIWNSEITELAVGPREHRLRGTPLVAGGMLLQGVTATMIPEGGFIVGLNLETGEEMWRFHSVARPGTPGGNTWNDIPLQEREGGSVWLPGSFDPELDLVYYGLAPTYNTAPLLDAIDKPGVSNDALYTNATVALRPGTGELVWYYQHIANDQWDLDWVYERHIMELEFEGIMRKVVMTAGKMALYDAVDAATGEYLFSIDMGLQNIVTAVDPETGAKTISPDAIPNAELSHLLCPYVNGGRNWPAAAYNPNSKMLYLPLAEVCMMAGPTGQGGSLLSTGVNLQMSPTADSDGRFGRWQAINVQTRELAWAHRELVPPTGAALATAGGLVFIGALDQSFKALDDATGAVLWTVDLGDLPTSYPISYSVNGKQFVAVAIGTPTVNANLWLGLVNDYLGGGDNLISQLSRNGPALMVFALE